MSPPVDPIAMALSISPVSLVPLQAADWAFVFGQWKYLLGGTLMTAALTITSILLGFAAGFPAGAIEVYGDGIMKKIVSTAGVVFRGTPLVVILMVLFFLVPISGSAFVTATLGLGLRSAAYQSQIFRGALQSVDEGQIEAARAVGMSYRKAIGYVVVPQALRRSMPGFQNEFTIVLKDTSIAFAIGFSELLTRGTELYQGGQNSAVFEVFVVISAIYFVLTFTTNRALDVVDERYSIPTGENT